MIKPERRKHEIVAYVTKSYKEFLKREHRKRGLGMSELIRVALYEYFNPKLLAKSAPIVRIDRTPKGSKEPIRKNFYRECIVELRMVLEKRRINNE